MNNVLSLYTTRAKARQLTNLLLTQCSMSKVVDQIINVPDKDYPDNYGHVDVIVRDTETGETATASREYDLFTKEHEAEAGAIQDALDKL